MKTRKMFAESSKDLVSAAKVRFMLGVEHK